MEYHACFQYYYSFISLFQFPSFFISIFLCSVSFSPHQLFTFSDLYFIFSVSPFLSFLTPHGSLPMVFSFMVIFLALIPKIFLNHLGSHFSLPIYLPFAFKLSTLPIAFSIFITNLIHFLYCQCYF